MFFFDRAFRSFFLGGSIFAFVSMLIWWLSFSGVELEFTSFKFSGIPPLYWHAHEMVFGYALATVTGFLLTAAMNWTGKHSASGYKLLSLFILWVMARIGYLVNVPLEFIAVVDIGFTIGLFLHFAIPVIKAKLWEQAALAFKFFLLIIANSVYYAGAFGWLQNGFDYGVTSGLFFVLAINMTMMRRLIPFFTEKALQLPEHNNPKWMDIASLVGLLSLAFAAIFSPHHWITSVIAFPLAALHAVRFMNWYDAKIWGVKLLWPLHVSYFFMILGIGLYGFVGLQLLTESLAIHALAAGGVGLLCSSMMARISLGHTHRNVFEPPRLVTVVFMVLTITAVTRVILPILIPSQYLLWIQFSQWGWASSFLLLSILYWKILTGPSLKNPMTL